MKAPAAWALAGLSIAAFFAENARAVTYTLSGSATSGSASWNLPSSWSGGVVANGADNTADLSANLLTGNLTFTLDGNQTIGNLLFGDTGAVFNTTLAAGTNGSLTLAASSGAPVINVANETATISAVISGFSGLNKTGAGTLTLSAANSLSGLTQISGGILTLGNSLALQNSTLDYNGYGGTLNFGTLTSATLGGLQGSQNITLANTLSANVALTISGLGTTYSGVLSGGGSLAVSSAGSFTLTNANTYTGVTAINGGTLTLDFSQFGAPAGNIVGSGSTLVVAGGSLNVIGGFVSANTQAFNGLTINSGASTLTETANGNPLLVSLGAITRAIGDSVDFVQPTSTIGSTNGFATTTANTNGILGGWASVGQTDWAFNNGTDIVALPAASYTKDTWTAGKNTTVTLATNTTIPASSTTNSLRFGGLTPNLNRTVTLSGTNIITSGGILVADNAGAFTATITGGILEGAAGGDLVILQYNTAGALTIATTIADNTSATGLTKSGAGNLNLTAANTYTGLTTINAGTLTIGIANAIGSSSAVTINGGTLALGAKPDQVAALTLVSGSITNSSTAGILTASSINLQSGSVAAILAGTGGLTKTTYGTVTISKASTFTGAVAIKAGTLRIGVTNALTAADAVTLGDNTVSPNTGAILDLNGFNQSVGGLSSLGNGQNIITNSAASGSPSTLATTKTGTWGGVIQDGTGGIALTVSSGAVATFTGANTYTGQTLVQNATLVLAGGSNTISAGNAVQLNNGTGTGGILQLGNANGASNQALSLLTIGAGTTNRVVGGNATQTSTFTINNSAADLFQGYFGSGTMDGAAVTAANDLAFIKTGSGTFTLGNSAITSTVSTFDGGTTINQGTLALGIANALPAAKSLTFGSGTLTSGAVTLNGGALDLAGFSDTVGVITLAGGSIVNSGSATAVLTATSYNVQSGLISASLGGSTVTLTKTTSGVVTLSGANTYAGGTTISAGTLTLGAANTLSSAGAVTIGGGVLDLGGFSDTVGAVTLNGGSIINSGSPAVLTGSSYNVQSGAISAVLGGAGSTLTKTGSDTVTLTAANTYNGATSINGGVLNVSATQTGGGAFSVSDGAALGVAISAPGQTLNVSSLTIGNTSGGAINLNLGALGNTTAPVISIGALTLYGTNIVNISGGGLSVGEFPLFAYTGSIGGSGSLILGTLPARVSAVLDPTSVPNEILLNITSFSIPRWTGSVSGNWDIDDGSGTVGTLNWKLDNNAPTGYYQSGALGTDSVIFDDSAAGTATLVGGATKVTLTTTLTPISITVNNSVLNYIFTGSGKLSGGAGLLKNGSGTLILSNTGGNDYTGATTISGGILQLGDGSTPGAGQLGSGPVSISLGGSLVLDRPSGDNFTLSNSISGAGALFQNGGDTVTLSGNNASFNGLFTVSSGTLKLGSLTGLGAAAGTVQAGAALDITGFGIANAVALNGGTVRVTAGTGNGLSGPISLSGTGGIADIASGASLTLSGPIGGSGGFTKNGAGSLLLSSSNNYAGGTAINAGLLRLGNAGALGSASYSAVVQAGATLDLAGFGIAEPLQLNGGVLQSSSGAAGADSGAITLTANSTVDVAANSTLTLSGSIGGSAGITKTSGGTLILSGLNTYGGGVTVNTGTLEFASASAEPVGGAINLGAGVTLALGYAFDQSLLDSIPFTLNAATVALLVNDANNLNFANQPGFSLGAIGAATYSGNLTPGAANYNLGGGGGTLTFASQISGAVNVIIGSAGPGVVILSNANSYTGSTTVTAGTLVIGNARALGLTSGLTVNGTLDLNGFNLTVPSLAATTGVITDNSSTPGTTILTDSIATGTSTFTGSINDGPTRNITLVKAGAGTLVINKANGSNYTGGTIISGGLLDVRTNNAQVLPNGSSLTFTGTATLRAANNGTGTGSLTLGSLTFSAGLGSVVNYLQSTGAAQNLTFTGAVTRSIGAAGLFSLGNGASAAGYKFFLTGVTPNRFINPGVYYLGSDFAVADGSAGNVVRAVNYAGDANAANALLSTDQNTLAIAAGGTVTSADLQLSGTGNILDEPSETLNSLKIGGANNLTLDSTGAGATLTISSGGLLKAGGGTATISGGAGITTGGGPGDLVVRAAVAGDVLTIASSILATTTGGVTKSGAGLVILSGNNAFSGVTNILEGSLQVGNANALGGSADGTTVYSGATLDLGGFFLPEPLLLSGGTVTSSSGVVGGTSGPMVLSGAGTIDAPISITTTYTGPISGTGTLTKTSPGIAILSGSSTFTGNVTITAGTIDITNSGALGIGPKVISVSNANRPSLALDGSGGNIILDASLSFTLSNDGVANTGNTLGAIVNLAGNNTINGVLSLVNGGGGNIRVQSQGGTLTLAGVINANGATGVRTLLLGGPANGTISGVITDGLTNGNTEVVSVTKDGTGTWLFSGGNSYSGATVVSAGTIQVNSIAPGGVPQPLGVGSPVITLGAAATAGTLEYTGAVAATLDRSITTGGAAGGVVKNSSGALLSLTGAQIVAAGPLTLTGGSFVDGGQITGAALNGGLTINNARVTLTNAASTYSGPTTVIGGGVLTNGLLNAVSTLSSVTLGESVGNTGGAYDLAGFNQTITGLNSAGTGVNIITNSGLSGTNTLAVSGAGTFGGTIRNGANATTALDKTQAGALTLTGANTYSGATTVDGGTLIVSGSISGTANVTVNSGGTLAGNGTIATAANGNVTVASGGILSPGSTVGKLTLTLGSGQLDLSAAAGGPGYLKFDLGLSSDQIAIATGALNIGTGLSLTDFVFTDSVGFGPGSYVLFTTNSDIQGALGANTTGTVLGLNSTLTLADGTNGRSDVVLLVVPEPGVGASLIGGLAILLGFQRRRRYRSSIR